MKQVVRWTIETLLLLALAVGLLIGAISALNQIADEPLRYAAIGYYIAVHHNLTLWIWRHLRGEKSAKDRPR